MHGFISGISIVLHSPMCLFLCQCYTPFDYCSFVLQSKVGEHISSSVLFFLQKGLGQTGSFVVPNQFQDHFFQFCEIPWNILIGRELQTALSSMDILTISILPFHEHSISFHLCHPQFILSVSYSFSGTNFLPPQLDIYLCIFYAMVLWPPHAKS